MIKDYSGSFTMTSGRNRIKTPKRKSFAAPGELFPATGLMLKTVGAMVLLVLLTGIGSTIWYGMQVRVALDQIGSRKALNSRLQDENSLLLVKRDLLLTREQMETAANKLGLQSPAENQLRYP